MRYRQVHVDKTGDHPEEDDNPTVLQLSGLHHRFRSGKAPYVDLGLFGPYGDRFFKLRKYTAMVLVEGEW